MKTSRHSFRIFAASKTVPFLLGVLLGAAWALRLDEEQQRRLKKNLFELREMPFRVFI